MNDRDRNVLHKIINEASMITNMIINFIAGLRDVTAHGYQTLEMGDIWNTIITDIPILQENIVAILNE